MWLGIIVVCFFCYLFRWFSKCVLQNRGQEIIDGLKGSLQGVICLILVIDHLVTFS